MLTELKLQVSILSRVSGLVGVRSENKANSAQLELELGLSLEKRQAGAELYQAQVKLGLAKLTVTRKKLSP